MKFLHRYKDYEDFDRDYNGENYEEPWVSVTEDTLTEMSYSDLDSYTGDYAELLPKLTIKDEFYYESEISQATFVGGFYTGGIEPGPVGPEVS